MYVQQRSKPRLVVLGPEVLRGRVFELGGDHVVIGRDQACDVTIDDPHISRRHAASRRVGERIFVSDLDSRGGTRVNDADVTEPVALRNGDIVSFATVTLRFEAPGDGTGQAPGTLVWQPPDQPRLPAPVVAQARYDIGHQQGGVVSNVGRDQHNYHAYVQHVMHERASFLREIAGTKSKAWLLVWFGFLLSVGGGAVWGANILVFIQKVQDLGPDANPDDLPLLGREVLGIPIAVIGLAAAVLGSVLLIVGIVLHIVAAARRRKVAPIPPPHRPY